ncbi:MAG: protein TolQ, partial [Beggiatoa sp. IS2]
MNELSLIQLVLNASLLVQIVMLLLISISVFSWMLIFSKGRALRKARRVANRFEDLFWNDKDLNSLYNNVN